MSDQPSPRDIKLAAATRRLDAVEQAALRMQEPGRGLMLSIVEDLRTAMAGEALWTPAAVDESWRGAGRIDAVGHSKRFRGVTPWLEASREGKPRPRPAYIHFPFLCASEPV